MLDKVTRSDYVQFCRGDQGFNGGNLSVSDSFFDISSFLFCVSNFYLGVGNFLYVQLFLVVLKQI